MGKLIALITLAAFIWLAMYSKGSWDARQVTMHPQAMQVISFPKWRTQKAAAIADIFGISPEDVTKPVNIWGL